MNTLYLGLRAYKLSDPMRAKVRTDADAALGSAGLGPGGDKYASKDAYMFQIIPFSSRKAYLCQHVQDQLLNIKDALLGDEIAAELLANPGITEAQARINVGNRMQRGGDPKLTKLKQQIRERLRDINAAMASHKHGEKKSRFDDDVFDAVRTEDLANMVGCWKVGRVLDVKAARYATYDGGPSDSGFALTVDVQTSWLNALPLAGGSVGGDAKVEGGLLISTSEDLGDVARQYVEHGTNEIGRDGKRVDYDTQNAYKNQMAVDTYNAQFPSMRTTVGNVFGSALYSYSQQTLQKSQASGEAIRVRLNQNASNVPSRYLTPPSYIGDGAWANPMALLSVSAEGRDADATTSSAGGAAEGGGAPSASLAPPLVPTPASTGAAATPTPTAAAPASTAAAPASTAAAPASTAAAAASAPITAAAMAAVAASRPGSVARGTRKSPARSRPAAAATTGTSAATSAATAAPTAAPTAAAAAAKASSSTPAVSTSTPAAASTAAPATGSSVAADLLSSTAAPAQRRRERAPPQTSTVSAVFDSIFGGGEEEDPVAAPASPTPSSGSDASGTGPKVFRRPR
jgi:hypothetical protein